MSTEPFTDEILSAIIDGEADAETVAAVQADPAASARLVELQRAVDLVATPVADATPERRSASIAAAMAAAQPSAPEVTSLAAARHERRTPTPAPAANNRQWLALVAAAVFLVVAIPLVLQFRSGNEAADTASDATSDNASLAVDDAADTEDAMASDGDAMDDGDDGAAASDESAEAEQAEATADDGDAMEEAAEDDAMEEDAGADAMEDDAGDDAMEEPADEPVSAVNRLTTAIVVDSVENLDEVISFGSVTPLLTLDQVVEAGLSPTCVDQQLAEIPPEFAGDPLFDIVFLDEDGLSEPRLIIVRFNDDGTTTALDAEDCAPLG